MAFSYNKKNLANTTITGAITPTQTSVTVADATVFSYAFFYATLMPSNEMSNASNSEIVLVTNIQGNTLTLVRGQENTIARSFPYGAVITNGIYTRDIDYARSIGRKVFMARDDGTDDTNTSYQITDPMIKNVPEEGSIITVEFDTPSYGAPTLGVNNGIGGLVQVSGTDIHITDSSGQIDSVEMYGDTQQTTYSGKNLYEGSPSFDSYNSISAWEDGGTYNGMPVVKRAAAWTGVYRLINIEAGVTYTFSAWVKSDEARPVAIYAIGSGATATITPNNKNITTTTSWERVSFTFTCSTSGTIALRFENTSASTTNYTYISGYQLEKNSSATSFEPYVGGTASPNPDYPQEVKTVTGEQTITVSNGQGESQVYPINLGKNLFELGSNLDNYFVTVSTGTKVYTDNDKSFVTATFSGNKVTFTDYVTTNWRWVSKVVPLEKNTTYTISGDWTSSLRIVGFDSLASGATGTLIRQINPDAGQYPPATFDSGSYNYVVVSLYPGEGSKYFDSIQIEKGSVATTYAPYFTPIELCKIGTYQDYIYKSGEDWYVKKNIANFTLNGSESWDTTGTNVYALYIPGGIKSISEGLSGVCNYYTFNPVQTNVTITLTTGQFAIQYINPNTQHRLFMKDTSISTTSDFQTWLGTHNTKVCYPLATPTDTQITNSALIAQLNALYNMLTEGVADVVVTGDLPGSLTIKYYQQGTGTYTAPIVGGAEIDGGDNEQVVELDSYLPYRLVYDTNGYWRVLNKGPKVTTGAIMDGAVTAAKITRDNINYGTTSSDIRIGTFDGKPLWRRVQKFTNIPTGYSVHNWTAGTIANLNSIVAVNGMWAASGSTTYVPINSLPPDAVTTYGIAIRDFTASSWAVVLGTSMNTVNSGYIILDYTKTS